MICNPQIIVIRVLSASLFLVSADCEYSPWLLKNQVLNTSIPSKCQTDVRCNLLFSLQKLLQNSQFHRVKLWFWSCLLLSVIFNPPLGLTQDGFFERKVSNLLFFFSSCVLIRALYQALFPQATLTGCRYILTYQCFQNGPGEMQPRGAHQLCPPGKQSLDIHWFKGLLFTMK